MMKRRSKLKIYLDVLKAVSETGRLTHIGNLANLSWNDTVKHLEFLELKGFVENRRTENGRAEYALTRIRSARSTPKNRRSPIPQKGDDFMHCNAPALNDPL